MNFTSMTSTTSIPTGNLAESPLGSLQTSIQRPTERSGLSKQRRRAERVVNQLVKRTDLHQQLVSDPELSEWLLKQETGIRRNDDRNIFPFLAAVGLEVNPPTPAQRFEHLIVDEAQDIRPLEWRILSKLLDDEGTWSLFGDLHQRRSDYSLTWAKLEEFLEIPISEEILSTGFRSTNEILKYASRLLPKNARGHLWAAVRTPSRRHPNQQQGT